MKKINKYTNTFENCKSLVQYANEFKLTKNAYLLRPQAHGIASKYKVSNKRGTEGASYLFCVCKNAYAYRTCRFLRYTHFFIGR